MNGRNKPESIKVGDLPQHILDSAIRSVQPYSVGVLCIEDGAKGEDLTLAASGTLAKLGQAFCVLTAGHFIDSAQFKDCDNLGLSIETKTHTFRIARQHCITFHVWNKYHPEAGPDLGLIKLPEIEIGWLKAKKSFWNLATQRSRAYQFDWQSGCWGECGWVREFLTARQDGSRTTYSFQHNLWLGGIAEPYVKDGYDYVEAEVLYQPGNLLPSSFRGLSGGGLWQIIIQGNSSGDLSIRDPILCGVAFYETGRTGNSMRIRSHFRDSIYSLLPQIVRFP